MVVSCLWYATQRDLSYPILITAQTPKKSGGQVSYTAY